MPWVPKPLRKPLAPLRVWLGRTLLALRFWLEQTLRAWRQQLQLASLQATLSVSDWLFEHMQTPRQRSAPPLLDWGRGISVVIPERGGVDLLGTCLAGLYAALAHVDEASEVIIVVNGSPRADYAALTAKYPQVQWLYFEHALGFTRAVLQGVAQARHGSIYLLNNDMRLEAAALCEVLRWRAPQVFAIATQILFPDDGRRREETGWTFMPMSDGLPAPYHAESASSVVRGTVWAGAGSALFHAGKLRELLPGSLPFDPFYWEDVDLGVRAWREGYESRYCPASKALHLHRVTVQRYYPAAEVERIFERNRLQLQLRNPFPRQPRVAVHRTEVGAALAAIAFRAQARSHRKIDEDEPVPTISERVAALDARTLAELGHWRACLTLWRARWRAFRSPFRDLSYDYLPLASYHQSTVGPGRGRAGARKAIAAKAAPTGSEAIAAKAAPTGSEAIAAKAAPTGSEAIAAEAAAMATGTGTLILVSPFAILPPRHGGALRTHRLAGELAQDWQVILLSDEAELYGAPDHPSYAPFAAVHLIDGRPQLAPELQSDRLERMRTHAHSALRLELARLIAMYRPSAVLIEHMELAHLVDLRTVKGPQFVLSLQDVLLQPDDPSEADTDRIELELIDQFDAVLVSSAEDQALLGARRSVLVANGCDADQAAGYRPSRGRNILFVGPFRAAINWDGIRAFVAEVYPAIEAAVPGVSLTVVGGSGAPQRAAAEPGFARASITVVESVESLRDLLDAAALTINPQQQLRGSSIKVLEALASGRVCVSTAAGARGHRLHGFAGLIECARLRDFAPALIELLLDEPRRIALEAPDARRLEQCSWQASGLALREMIDELVGT